MICGGEAALRARDLAGAVRFYVEELGMKLVAEHPGRAVIDAGDGLRVALSPDAPTGHVTFFVKLPVREVVAIFENRGLSFELSGEGAETRARFRDPDGNTLILARAVAQSQ